MTEQPLDYRNHAQFLGLSDRYTHRETSWVWMLPIPLDMTTSYLGGTRFGPDGIIAASNQVELYDSEAGCEAALRYGVHVLPALHPSLASPEVAVKNIASAVAGLPVKDKLLVSLGGEHTITPGIVSAFKQFYPDLVVVQIDAHADLRNSFDGTPYSHACTGRRISEYAPIIQFGVRALCPEEVEFIACTDRVKVCTAEAMVRDRDQKYLDDLETITRGKPIYLTIDLDGLDPSIIPAVGTPEPGGIGWYECLDLIRRTSTAARIVALDCVELCPMDRDQRSAYTAATLIYRTINLIWKSTW